MPETQRPPAAGAARGRHDWFHGDSPTAADEREHLLAVGVALAVFPRAGLLDPDNCADAAVELSLRGFQVLPVRPRSKVPATPRGLLDATDDPTQVADWWSSRYRGCGVAVRVPEAVFVLDVDPRSGGDRTLGNLEARHGKLPPTLTVVSGRGDGGGHHYFRHPGGPLTGVRLAGIDLKLHSGYLLVPPTLHPEAGRPYQWLDPRPPVDPPRWLVRLLRPTPPSPRPQCASTATGTRLAGLVNYVQALTPGGRNSGLFWAASRVCEETGGGERETALAVLADAARRMPDPLPEREIVRTLSSARGKGAS